MSRNGFGILVQIQVGPGVNLFILIKERQPHFPGRTRVMQSWIAAQLIDVADKAIDPRARERAQSWRQCFSDVEYLLVDLDLAARLFGLRQESATT